MTIDEKLMDNENFRKKCWDRINYEEEFKKEFLHLEMKRTIPKEVYDAITNTFGGDPLDNYRWYFAKNLNLAEKSGKSPYQCCIDKDYQVVTDLLGRIEYGVY